MTAPRRPGRVLLCSPAPLTRRLGAAKVPLELADALRALGWEADVVGPETYARPRPGESGRGAAARARGLRALFRARGGHYDVVDIAAGDVPDPRPALPAGTRLVVRVPLLDLHLDRTPLPTGPWTARRLAGALVKGPARAWGRRRRRRDTLRSLGAADRVIVNNARDRDELVRRGLAPDAVVVTALGLSRERLAALAQPPEAVVSPPVVAFVGTFDWRKGAAEFPALVAAVSAAVPGVRFRLVGTRGLFPDEAAVRRRFPAALQGRIEVYPTFAPEALPGLLAGCAAGVFPSHLEGFGFGVLEMLAAALPVVAYDVPGPPEMLPAEWLVPRGDADALADRLAGLLANPAALVAARARALARAAPFTWDHVAAQTAAVYAALLDAR